MQGKFKMEQMTPTENMADFLQMLTAEAKVEMPNIQAVFLAGPFAHGEESAELLVVPCISLKMPAIDEHALDMSEFDHHARIDNNLFGNFMFLGVHQLGLPRISVHPYFSIAQRRDSASIWGYRFEQQVPEEDVRSEFTQLSGQILRFYEKQAEKDQRYFTFPPERVIWFEKEFSAGIDRLLKTKTLAFLEEVNPRYE